MTVARVALDDLSASIRADLGLAARHVRALTEILDRLPGRYDHFAVAMLLQHLYGSIEAIVERSVKLFDGLLPEGSDWHVRLLSLASVEVEGKRPAILPTIPVVDELRRFRHRLRKRYDVELDPERTFKLACTAISAWPALLASLDGFLSFVDDCAGRAT